QAALDRVLRRLRAPFARRAPSLVRRRILSAPGQRRTRLQAAQSEGRPVLPHHRRPPAHPHDRGRALVAARHARRRSPPPAGPPRPPPPGPPTSASAFGDTNPTVSPRRPARAWVGYIAGGAIVLDISDMAPPRMLSRWDYPPPYPGFTHTLLPLFDPQLVIVSD